MLQQRQSIMMEVFAGDAGRICLQVSGHACRTRLQDMFAGISICRTAYSTPCSPLMGCAGSNPHCACVSYMLLQVPASTKDVSAPPAPGNTASSAVNRRKQATAIAQVCCRTVLICMHPVTCEAAAEACIAVIVMQVMCLAWQSIGAGNSIHVYHVPQEHSQVLQEFVVKLSTWHSKAMNRAGADQSLRFCNHPACVLACRRTMHCTSAWWPSGPARISAGRHWRQGTGRTSCTVQTAHSSRAQAHPRARQCQYHREAQQRAAVTDASVGA
jgi:hypothetical protein